MAQHGMDIIDSLLDRQKEAWSSGGRTSVEEFLNGSACRDDAEAMLDLIYGEILLREELGEKPDLEEYVQRFPNLADALKLHFEVHRAVHGSVLVNTHRLQEDGTLADVPLPEIEAGPRLADYEILGELGQGGMGVVYKARHHRLKRLVALKMVQPGRRPSPRELLRFRAEAEAIARLQHPNVVQIFEVGQTDGLPFLALEFAELGTLAQRLQNMPLTPHAAAELIATLAQAMHHAHLQHIAHLDLKPANILFARDGTPKITDFGLAKLLADDADAPRDPTRNGEPVGTPRYMAPEQAGGRPDQIGPATDIYALGNMLYECMTGQAPFVSPSVVETMEKIRADEPAPPRRLQRAIPRDLETVCLNCLHKQPHRRYASALALAADLLRFLQGEPIHARRTPPWERAWMWCRRRPARATLIAMGVLLAVTAVAALGMRQRAEERRIANLRLEMTELVQQGHDAVAQGDVPRAEDRFLRALATIKGEPALREHELGVQGWLDQSLRDRVGERWKKRRAPMLFDELRDEALLQSVILEPRGPESLQTARRAIQAALDRTVADDPAWRPEREQLVLLDADLLLRSGDAAAALALLDQHTGVASRLWHNRRADCLERLGRQPEADEERQRADKLASRDALGFFLSGVDRFDRQDFDGAVRDFDRVLAVEPEHFTGRFFQAACFLRLKRPGEAKVALTACIAQRPQFCWSFLLRGQAFLQSGDRAWAAQDFQRCIELSPDGPARPHAQRALDTLPKAGVP
jgi:eukaryotic-like serine/threonine-protein kinase